MFTRIGKSLSVVALAGAVMMPALGLSDEVERQVSKPVERLVQVAQMDRYFEQVSTALLSGMSAELDADPNLPPEERRRMLLAAQSAWSTEQVRHSMENALHDTLSSTDVAALLEYYESPFGRRVTNVMNARDTQQDPQAFVEFSAQFPQTAEYAERSSMASAIVVESDLVDRTVNIFAETQTAVVHGLLSAYDVPVSERQAIAQELEASGLALLAQMEAYIEVQAPMAMAWQMEELSLEDVSEVLEISRRPEQKNLLAALFVGMHDAIVLGGDRFVQALAKGHELEHSSKKPKQLAEDSSDY